MTFEIEFPTRHTDAFAATGYVHAGVLLGLTEMAYAAFERHCGFTKPETVYAVQKATEVVYRSPLRWDEGVRIRVHTTGATARGFDQEHKVTSARDDRSIATFTHHWVWLDTATGRPFAIPDDIVRRLRAW